MLRLQPYSSQDSPAGAYLSAPVRDVTVSTCGARSDDVSLFSRLTITRHKRTAAPLIGPPVNTFYTNRATMNKL